MSQNLPQALSFTARQGLTEIDPNRAITQRSGGAGKPVVSAVPSPWPQFAPAPLIACPSVIQTAPAPCSVPVSAPIAALPKVAPSSKRKSDTLEDKANITPALAIEGDDQAPQVLDVTDDCDVVRRKIRAFIDAGEMKVGDFQRAIGVSPSAYSTFMKQDGSSAGQRSATYKNAFAFFKKRELNTSSIVTLINRDHSKTVKRAKKDDTAKAWDVSNITLPGEGHGRVPVFDTCNEIRKKIRAFLKKNGMSQAAFCRELTKMVAVEGRKVNASSLANFLAQKGPSGGSVSIVFYAAYVYFEKIRVRDGKPKSQMRQEMESVWGWEGMNIPEEGRGGQRSFLCRSDEYPYEDKYGKVHFVSR
ncbi:hypothetical protein BR93DRAFT_474822 [Coniochaeta sp. PMI_546]|nr:hypothetical protein BR93DRAFT_474822 [Coniochaeta sp. PMI_546]